MAFKISGSAFQGISSLGSSVPEAGPHTVSIVKIETSPNDKPGTRRFHVQFENGFKMFTFVSLPYDDNGNVLPGLTDKQVRGRMAALRTILESLGYTRENIETTDTLLTLYPSVVTDRDCRAFDTQPFGRCTVVFYYDDHDGKPCPIYEEFTFNDAGEITWIEAWSDVDGLRPTTSDDPWGEDGIDRLATRIPGLGTATGTLDLDSPEMAAAAEADPDVADFVTRANDWYGTWIEEYQAAGDDLWEVGCGW